jgi:hypothetical protein
MANFKRNFTTIALIVVFAALAPSCGGGGGGAGPDGAGQGLVLVGFLQDGIDNIQLNTALIFTFSEPVNAATVSNASIQIRQGDGFGLAVPGTYEVSGSTVIFTPQLPGNCDNSDSGFQPDTQYRVQFIGYPEEFAIKNTKGQSLDKTSTHEFHTRADTDPEKFRDQVPGQAPFVVSSTPAAGTAAEGVVQGNSVVLTMSENLSPCTVGTQSVVVEMAETGDPLLTNSVAAPNGNLSGFYFGASTEDQAPGDDSTWAAAVSTTISPAQVVRSNIRLEQDFSSTRIIITPEFGEWPDNALIVVRLSFAIEDFGGTPLSPFSMSFTTQNLDLTPGTRVIRFEGETPIDKAVTTADVNTTRAPKVAQAYMLFAGDGDNGVNPLQPTLPNSDLSGCTTPFQNNNGVKNNYDPASDETLDTGPFNSCANTTDGSTAVIWEFASLRIRSGVTVNIIGENPAILLVQGDVLIENGGELNVAGENGGAGDNKYNSGGGTPTARPGGTGRLGGGDGGNAKTAGSSGNTNPGHSGFGSSDPWNTPGGVGAGKGTANYTKNSFTSGGGGMGGGGGGHSIAGLAGTFQGGNAIGVVGTPDGSGGGTYPGGANADQLFTPSAGSGGGAGGYNNNIQTSYAGYKSTGGAGGAGGGFLDITSAGDVNIFGLIDASGGRGGVGGVNFYSSASGGGGGSGGGIRILTPNDINVAGGTITAAGGSGGGSGVPQGGGNPGGSGGAGGVGRIVLEDGDSVITGFATATLVPTEGDTGFFRGTFNAGRFLGGGLEPEAVTGLFASGPLNPAYVDPVASDFIAKIPALTSTGSGFVGMYVEVRGIEMKSDGTADNTAPYEVGPPSGYYTVGYFTDSGNENAPVWTLGHPAAKPRAPDNVGDGITSVNGYEFLQVRIHFFLKSGIGPFDAGPIVDDWTIRFTYNN